MRIVSVESFANPMVALVRVRAEDGAAGWGQVSPYHADLAVEVLHRQVAPHVLGMAADDTAAVTRRVLEREHKFQGTYLYRALAGVDTALWDLRGKRAGLPVRRLLGDARDDFPLYASSMKRDITPEAEAERMLALRESHGFGAFKFRIGAECGNDVDQWPGRTEAIIKTMREALGDDAALLVDANSGFSPARAIEVGRLLADYGVGHFEEPCPYWDLDATGEVTAALAIDVSGGEQDNNLTVWKKMIDERVVDIVQPDICYMGGVTRTLQVAEYAARAGIPCTLHSANLSLVTLFSMHFMTAIANAGKYVEYSIEGLDYYPWQQDLFTPGYAVSGGRVELGDGPGWGIDINPDWLAASQHRVSYHPASS